MFYNPYVPKKKKTENEGSPAIVNTNNSTEKNLTLRKITINEYALINQKVEKWKNYKIQKFVVYPHLFLDLLQTPRKMFLIFQMDTLFVCPIPRYLEDLLSAIDELRVVPGENFQKLCTEVTSENSGIIFQEITLYVSPQTQNQAANASQSLDDFYDHFADTLSHRIDYIKDLFRI